MVSYSSLIYFINLPNTCVDNHGEPFGLLQLTNNYIDSIYKRRIC